MGRIYYNADACTFFDDAVHSIDADELPTWCVEVDEQKRQDIIEAKARGADVGIQDGEISIVEKPQERPILTREQVEHMRLVAYSDPLTGSDRYFSEALRLQATGGSQEEIDSARAAGATRYAEIQAANPWPPEV